MSAYQFSALKPNGSSKKGLIEADSERHARQLLREQSLIPTKIERLKKSGKHCRSKISTQDLSLLTRQLATLLAAGIPVDESLQGVAEQSENEKVRQLLAGVRSKVIEGHSLAQALGAFPRVFPELYRATVAAGEQSGRLDIVLEKLAQYTENQQQTKQKIQQALIYPLLMVTVSVVIVGFLMTFVVPKIIDVFNGSGQTLPPMTQVLMTLCTIIKSYGLYIALGFIALLYGFTKIIRIPSFRCRWHRLLLKTPLISFFIRTVNAARYIHTFAILFAAGVNVLDAMRVSAGLINNDIMYRAFHEASHKVKEGASIHEALKETTFIGAMPAHLIASGERSGQLAPMMERSASQLDLEVKRLIDTGLTLLEPIIILLMGGVVLFIVLATLLPIFSMEQLVL